MKKLLLIAISIWALTSGFASARNLNPGESLAQGAQLWSDNNQYFLTLQTDGNLVVYGPSGAVWATKTGGSGAAYAVMQTDGNFVLYNAANKAVWDTETFRPNSTLAMQDDGDVGIYWQRSIWASNTADVASIQPGEPNRVLLPGSTFAAGQSVSTGQYFLILQSDGNLVLYKNGGNVIWATYTQNRGVTHASMQGDGNFVLYAGTTPIYSTQTDGNPNSIFALQVDGNLVIYAPTPIWDWKNGLHHPDYKDHSGPGGQGCLCRSITIPF
ncbi:curculin (mannose-binding) lectin [Caballeronia sp. DA-9]|uniref:curculin (mannose-binding) lectin n=1 Tax=Caballeronia sp. DA-9 TaxID=3436237 RepID=UPI003F667B93